MWPFISNLYWLNYKYTVESLFWVVYLVKRPLSKEKPIWGFFVSLGVIQCLQMQQIVIFCLNEGMVGRWTRGVGRMFGRISKTHLIWCGGAPPRGIHNRKRYVNTLRRTIKSESNFSNKIPRQRSLIELTQIFFLLLQQMGESYLNIREICIFKI